jgi:Large polyvalent protein associated domain 30/Large polyvalent protein associated domain 29
MNAINHKLRIGSRVHCILYGGKDGVVYAIHGQQSPETCSTIGGFIMIGGSADFDIVWDNGTESHRIPESLIQRSSQWSILEGVATSEEIQSMRGLVILETQRRNDERDEKARKFAEAVAQLRSNPAYAHLEQTARDGYGSARQAAANIRAELKKAFPGVKFSVRSKVFSGGDSIDVSWTDGPITSAVESIAKKYSGGSFNGMEDLYEYSRSPWTAVFGDAKYIHCNRHHSLEALKEAVREVCLDRGWPLMKVECHNDGSAYLDCRSDDNTRAIYDFIEKRNQ